MEAKSHKASTPDQNRNGALALLTASVLFALCLPMAADAANFSMGQRVSTTASTEVRAVPSLSQLKLPNSNNDNRLGSHIAGKSGSVVGGPKLADGVTFWRIDYDDNLGGPDGWSSDATLQAAPADTTAPGVPANLVTAVISHKQVNLSWTRSTDNVPAGIVQHELMRNGAVIATTVSTNFQDTGVSPGATYSYSVRARDVAGNRSAASPVVVASTPATAPANLIDAMPVGTWLSVPASRIDAVQFQWPPSVLAGTGQPRYLTESSGAYDSRRNRFIIWGGGHGDYAGNEIYTFDIATLAWRRENDPTMWTDVRSTVESLGYYPDAQGDVDPQQPRSRHTYDYIAYLPNIDRFCSFGFFAGYPASRSGNNTDCFDFDQRRWERRADVPSVGQSLVAMAAYDPVSGNTFFYRGAAPLSAYDPLANRWSTHSAVRDAGYFYDATAIVDTKRKRFVAMGSGMSFSALFWYDLDAPLGQSTQHWVVNTDPNRRANLATGDTEILRARRPGFAYDPVNDVYVAWSGELISTDGDGTPELFLSPEFVWVIDPDTWVIKKIAPAAGNTSKPRSPFPVNLQGLSNSTFGRFAYIASKNVFILVNNWPGENVFFYKLDPASVRDGGAPAPAFDFSLSAGGSVSLRAGESATTAFSTSLLSGTAQSVAFEVSGLPVGATASFGAPQCQPPCSTALTVRTTPGTPVGVHAVSVAASGATQRHTAAFNLTVQAAAAPPASSPASMPAPSSAASQEGKGGGCALGGRSGAVDPLLALLCLGASGALARRRRAGHRR